MERSIDFGNIYMHLRIAGSPNHQKAALKETLKLEEGRIKVLKIEV